MDVVFGYIERYKFAILGTLLFHVAIFIGSNFTSIEQAIKFERPELPMDIPFDEMVLDPEIMELIEIPDPSNAAPEQVTNAAVDESDTRQESYDDFSTTAIDAEVEAEARNLEQQYFDEWASTHPDEQHSADIQTEDEDKENRNDRRPDNTISQGGDKKAAGAVLVSFKLTGRNALSLPKPGYTCNRSGVVMLDVKVDVNGAVKTATFNSAGSKNASECMIQQAMKYAKKSRFNHGGSSGTKSGTITYRFVG